MRVRDFPPKQRSEMEVRYQYSSLVCVDGSHLYGVKWWTLTKADELNITRQLLGFVVSHTLSFLRHTIRDDGCEQVKCVIQREMHGKRRWWDRERRRIGETGASCYRGRLLQGHFMQNYYIDAKSPNHRRTRITRDTEKKLFIPLKLFLRMFTICLLVQSIMKTGL